MRLAFSQGRSAKFGIAAVAFVAVFMPGLSQAKPLLPLTGLKFASSLFVMVDASSSCLRFIYDANGNRLSISSTGVQAAMTWGSGNYGCIAWSAP